MQVFLFCGESSKRVGVGRFSGLAKIFITSFSDGYEHGILDYVTEIAGETPLTAPYFVTRLGNTYNIPCDAFLV